MKNRKWIGLLAFAIVLGATAPAFSHHSAAMFDHNKQISVTGTVTQFVYTNPHGHLYLDVKRENGQTVNYWLEMANIPGMITRGISKTAFKAGDKLTVSVNPLKDGRPGGRYISSVGADGKPKDKVGDANE